MKILCNAIRAVTVEFCGVALVMWIVCGFASLGLRSGQVAQPMVETNVASEQPFFASLAGIVPNDHSFFSDSLPLSIAHNR